MTNNYTPEEAAAELQNIFEENKTDSDFFVDAEYTGYSATIQIYIGSWLDLMPSGLYYMPWCSSPDEETREKDQIFLEELESLIYPLWLQSGEGCATDVYICGAYDTTDLIKRIQDLDNADIVDDDLNHLISDDDISDAYIEHHFLVYGDYDNSCAVERSNARVMEDTYKDAVTIKYGAYYSVYCLIDISYLLSHPTKADDILSTLESLSEYPALDDEDVSLMEEEMKQEAWDNTYQSDLSDAIQSHLKLYEVESDSVSMDLCRVLEERANEYWICESGGQMYIDVDRLAKTATIEDLTDHKVIFTEFEE